MIEIKQTATYQKWYRKLKDRKARAIVAARIERLIYGHPGDISIVGDGISELRIHYGPGYRIYFARRQKDYQRIEVPQDGMAISQCKKQIQ